MNANLEGTLEMLMATQLEHQLVQNIEHLLHEHDPADVGRALRAIVFGVYVGS